MQRWPKSTSPVWDIDITLFLLETHFFLDGLHASWTFLVLQQQQNQGRGFGTSKMQNAFKPPPPPQWLRLLSILRRWFRFFVDSLLIVAPIVGFCSCSMLVVCYFVSILVFCNHHHGEETVGCKNCLVRLHGVSWLLCCSSSRCNRCVCSLWLWYFLIILTIFQ